MKMNSFRLTTRVYAIVAVALLVVAALGVSVMTSIRHSAYKLREKHLSDVVDSAVSIAQMYYDRAQAGEMDMEEAKRRAGKTIEKMRFDGKNYFFVFTYDSIVLVHGTKPDRVGQDQSNLTDPDGVKLYAELAAKAKNAGAGFVRYSTERPDASGEKVKIPKLSFVRSFKPWGWAVAAGSWVEDIEAEIAETGNIMMGVFLVGLLLLIGVSWTVGRSITRPVVALKKRMASLCEGELSAPIPSIDARDEIGDMARAVEVFRADRTRMAAMDEEKRALEQRAEAERAAVIQRLCDGFGAAAAAAAAGDFSRRVDANFAEEALQKLATDYNRVLDTVEAGLGETNRVMARVAEGDLSDRMHGRFSGAFADLQHSVNQTIAKLSELLSQIASTAEQVFSGSSAIASGGAELSSRAEQQASSLEETAATMEELASSIRLTAESASAASQGAQEASASADRGGHVVSEAIGAMSKIEESSGKVREIIAVIDGIAFQTNLLALNAAVEAARAGDAGKGFAVVASEVRALAQRSSEASQDIRQLIEASSQQVADGVQLVQRSEESLSSIVDLIKDVHEKIDSISNASSEQASGVSEISSSVSHLDEMTQRNSAMAETSAAEARSLEVSARELQALLRSFQLSREGGPASAAA